MSDAAHAEEVIREARMQVSQHGVHLFSLPLHFQGGRQVVAHGGLSAVFCDNFGRLGTTYF